MIRPLRQRHRRMFAILSVILPIALAAGVAARKPVPASSSPAGDPAEGFQRFTITQWSRSDLFSKTPFQVVLVRDPAGAGRFAIELSAPRNFSKPDLLVYWVAGTGSVGDVIPDDAILLGSFVESAPLLFPGSAPQSNGRLVLYSLADHEVVEVSKPISF
jgi:hypothetical protein